MSTINKIDILQCGLVPYRETLELQLDLVAKRQQGLVSDTVLVLEHLPVITLGARQAKNILNGDIDERKAGGVDVVQVRRGGGVTAHNPGQSVIYPIIALHEHGLGISDYIRKLEAIGISLLEELEIKAAAKKGFPGLWIGDKKIASIGVRVSKCVTYHGMAINIVNDLGIFSGMVPCGIEGVIMTNATRETGLSYDMKKVNILLGECFKKHFENI